MATPAETILAHLDGARQTGLSRWMARCPGPLHKRGDRKLSLSIGENAEGAALIHCFAGCEPAAILAALGLDLADLYPPRLADPDYRGSRPKIPPIPWRDVFVALQTNLTACCLAFSDLAKGRQFTPEDAAFIAQRADDLAYQVRRARGHGR